MKFYLIIANPSWLEPAYMCIDPASLSNYLQVVSQQASELAHIKYVLRDTESLISGQDLVMDFDGILVFLLPVVYVDPINRFFSTIINAK
mgnify:CR=1 FL=1